MKTSKASSTGTSRRQTVLIVDDHPMMREGLAQLLGQEADLKVSGQAATAREAMELTEVQTPDLVIADISLPDKSGLELIKDLQALHPGIRVLVISMHDEALYAERVLRAGGRGYVMKQEGGRKILEAIHRVLAGQVHVSDTMSARLLETFSAKKPVTTPVERLTDREFEVFQMIGGGLGTREIAMKLHLSVKTVEVHRGNIKEKLDIRSAPELIRYAVRWIEGQPGGGGGSC
jgi:DNA-binding NarL/FixJ family response regulator